MPRSIKRFPFALVSRTNRNDPWTHISYHTTYERALGRARTEQDGETAVECAIVVRANVKFDAQTFPTARFTA